MKIKKKKIVALIIIMLTLLISYILINIYLTIKVSSCVNKSFNFAEYSKSSFISEYYYKKLNYRSSVNLSDYDTKVKENHKNSSFVIHTFLDATYYRQYDYHITGFSDNGEENMYAGSSELIIKLKLINFKWVVVDVYDIP